MYWCVIHVKNRKYQELLDFFNAQNDVYAFIPMIEKWFSSSEIKEYQSVEMYPNYIFIKTSLSKDEFDKRFKDVFQSVSRFAELLEYDEMITLDQQEQLLLEKMLNGCETIKHSKGRIVDSILMIDYGPLVGMEDQITKINRHKRLAFLDCGVLGKRIKMPLEVVSKS